MKLLVLLGFVLATAAVGMVRFGGWLPSAPGWLMWLDALFILSAAGAVGMTISLIITRMHGATRDELLRHAPDDEPATRAER